MRELADFQVDQHIAAQQAVVENQIDEKMVVVKGKAPEITWRDSRQANGWVRAFARAAAKRAGVAASALDKRRAKSSGKCGVSHGTKST